MLVAGALSLGGCGTAGTPMSSPTTSGEQAVKITPSPSLPATSFILVSPESLLLSGEWLFAIDPQDVGQDEGWADPGFDDSGWTTVTVPHTWGVMAEHADFEGIAWYRRSFSLPEGAQDAHLRLHFDAVFYLAHVWLNGEYLGQHEGGYTPFEFDVNGLTQPGAENVIAVRVDNMRATDRIPAVLRRTWAFDWWNWGGIVRDVSLEVTSRAYIAGQQVVAVPHLTGMDRADRATVTGTVTLRNMSDGRVEGALVAAVLDDAGGLSALETGPAVPVSLAPGESVEIELAVEVTEPKLWHFDHPHLYRWSASLLDSEGEPLHTGETTFGIRLVELKGARFYLNGEPMRLVGLTRHADSPWHGLAETVTIMTQDYDDLKTLNMVFSRPVHYPQHEFILDYCDRHGILVIPEVPAWQLTARQMESERMRELEKQQLREMIGAAFNHPSVWAWSVGNEYESRTVAGYEFTRDMIEYVKTLDSTRPVGFASNQLASDPEMDATRFADFVMMNQYFGTWAAPKTQLGRALDDIHAAWPNKVVIISEYGFEPHWNTRWGPPSRTLDPSEYYFIPEDLPGDSTDADAQRQMVIREQMEVFRSKPFVAAAVFWTYQDYRTSSDFTMGVVDAERKRHGSWSVLREEHAPLRIESVSLSSLADGDQSATVTLRARGPVEEDLPAYTLRGYSLRWVVMSSGSRDVVAEGEIALPLLEPGAEWAVEAAWSAPEKDYLLTLSIIRPTGFAVIEGTYDSRGQPYSGE